MSQPDLFDAKPQAMSPEKRAALILAAKVSKEIRGDKALLPDHLLYRLSERYDVLLQSTQGDI